MAVRVISKTERNRFDYEGSTFYYRRISVSESLVINRKHTKRGITDYTASGLEIVEYCLLDWENVEDEHGQPIGFSKDLIKDLPDELINELSMVLREASPQNNALGN